ncbi:peptidase M1 family protein [Nonlabens ulvanivorans]|uniref:Peptidase M1 family protein n=1 Tax=Nonlabens ulvanivorans TaxID=906888 RepID=A0A081DD52_NONUL|nr:M1 family metallopeptidase [Nonlabens ulvanivorans]GAK76848.1 peptidase M1 family protein [Nonlabens ulvanivorans]
MTYLKSVLTFIIIFSLGSLSYAQLGQNKKAFTRQDSLRGSITPERAWWDITYYDLDIKVTPADKYIAGSNTIHYKVLQPNNVLQVDLQSPLNMTRAVQDGRDLEIRHEGNAHFIKLTKEQLPGMINQVQVFYEGNPREARNAPWDGGISWKKDKNGNDFVASSCQGLGASVWWPNKDHMYQEVDSMAIHVNVPNPLMNVSNGRLIKTEPKDDNTTTYHWFVKNPINNYGVNINIGDYVNFNEVYQGEKGDLDMNYYVLRDNLEKAQEQFKDATRMMEAFEHWFGPYPFYEDSFKLVEVPYLGMEHQSSVTYGNRFRNGYLGRDLSGTGWGMKFDFIIIHESGHEWFANNITNKDIADMWIHESFTAYSESLFLDFHYGTTAANEYVIGTRRSIRNDRPLIGEYDVNHEGSGDMYYKGANMIHTLRMLVNDKDQWRKILRDMNKVFYHSTVSTQDIEDFLSQSIGKDLEGFFNQYLRNTKIPKLVLKKKKNKLSYHWENIVDNFKLPIRIVIDDEIVLINPTASKQVLKLPSDKSVIQTDPAYYVEYKLN